MNRYRRLTAARALIASVVVVLSAWQAAQAEEFKTGEQVTIERDQVIDDDLYMTGDTMTVLGTVKGDVVASGRIVRIEGTIEGDLIAAGQVVEISGEVLDDVRMAGMTTRLAAGARVADDVFAAGFSFESEPGSEVGGKTGLIGYQAVIAGEHLQSLEASVVGIRIEGTVQGGVHATVEGEGGPAWWTKFMQSPIPLPVVQAGVELTDTARVEGDVVYVSATPAAIADGAQITGETRHEVNVAAPEPTISVGQRLAKVLRWLAVLWLLGAVLLWLVPDKMMGVARTMVERPLAAMGWGLVTLLAFPVAMILVVVLTFVLTMAFGLMTLDKAVALVLVVGLVVLLALAAKLWISVFYLAPVVAAFAGGRWLVTRKGGQEKSRYLSLLIGLALLALLGLVPFVGAIVKSLVTLIGLGAGSLWSVRYLARSETAEGSQGPHR